MKNIINTKVLLSGAMIVAAATVVVGATFAFFSDTETSSDNVFAAGSLDLKIDAQAHYNGSICSVDASDIDDDDNITELLWQGGTGYPVGLSCEGTWSLTDLTTEKFFNLSDIKPGDEGENTISIHVDNNDAWVCAEISGLTSADNTVTGPETPVDPDGAVSGELEENMIWTIWRDNGTGGGVAGDNIQNGTEPTLTSGNPVNGVLPLYDSTTATGPLAGDTTAYIGAAWSLPFGTGNEVQTDSLMGNISFSVQQSRNNPNFTCNPT